MGPVLAGVVLLLAGTTFTPLRAEPIEIHGPEALQKALREVKGGEVLRLSAGDYGTLRLILAQNPALAASRPITLISQDPHDPARFSGLSGNGVRNIVLDSLLFDYSFTPGDTQITRKFSLASVSGVTIRNSVFDGDLARESSAVDDGYPMATGLEVRESQDIRLEQNEFRRFFRGLLISRIKGLSIVGNDIHESRSEGMNLVQVEDTLIEGNHIHDFLISPNSGDHRDMIQFWSAGADAPSRRVTIRKNLLNSGDGLYTQSIFIRNERVDTGDAGREMFYQDFRIEENVIINAHLHGITMGEVDGLIIRNNTLIHNPRSDGEGGSSELWTPRIRVSPASENVTIRDNITSAIDKPDRGLDMPADWRIEGNLFIQDLDPGKPGWYDDVFVAPRSSNPDNLAAFFCLDSGPCMTKAVGAAALREGDAGFPGATGPAWRNPPGRPALTETAVIRVQRDPEYLNRFELQAVVNGMESRMKDPAAEPSFHWKIDGAAETGATRSVVFAEPGQHQIQLTVDLPSGAQAKAGARIDVPNPDLLRFDTSGLMVPARDGKPGATHWQAVQVKDMPHSQAIRLGGDQPVVTFPGSTLLPLFGARDFELNVRFRTLPGQPQPGGEMLRIHQLMLLGLTPAGGLSFQLFPAGSKAPVTMRTAPLRLHDGAWHDVSIRYSAQEKRIQILVDGAEHARTRMAGPIASNGNWGLSLGNPWGQKTMNGEVAAVSLRANSGSFLPPG